MALLTLEESIIASAWREKPGKTCYRLQVDNIFGKRNCARLIKQLEDWQLYGQGFTVRESKKYMLLFKRNFDNEEEWINWAKNFPFKLVELNKNGIPKHNKLGAYLRHKRGRPEKELK